MASADFTDRHGKTRWQHEYLLVRIQSVRDELASIRPHLRFSAGGEQVEAAMRQLERAIRTYPAFVPVKVTRSVVETLIEQAPE